MSRSLKKGPYIDPKLQLKVERLNQSRDKKVIWTFRDFKNFGNGLASAHVLGLPEGTRR